MMVLYAMPVKMDQMNRDPFVSLNGAALMATGNVLVGNVSKPARFVMATHTVRQETVEIYLMNRLICALTGYAPLTHGDAQMELHAFLMNQRATST